MKKSIVYLLIAGGMGIGLSVVWIAFTAFTPVAAAHFAGPGLATDSVVTVCHGGSCDYSSIQTAVDAAGEGDFVKVAQGVYTDLHVYPRRDLVTTGVVTQVVYIDKSITLQGGYSTIDWSIPDPENHPTILDAGAQGRAIYITGDISPVVKGFRITGGDAEGQGGNPWADGGGGIYVYGASAILEGNVIFGNSADSGGGIHLTSSVSSVVVDNLIEDNQAATSGGVHLDDSAEATISGNVIRDNQGGGIGARSSDDILVWQNQIISNTAVNGGGLFLGTSSAIVAGNTIAGNQASNNGGGVYFFSYGEQPELDGNLIISNTANYNGGGLHFDYLTDAVMTNNVIAANRARQGGGMYVKSSSPRLLHNTIARNLGEEGLYVTRHPAFPSRPVFTNTILISHTVGISVTGANTVTVNGILWHSTPVNVSQSPTATLTLQNEYTGDPGFAPDGYHLSDGSDAEDRGILSGVARDIDGEPRPNNGYDLGADEYWPPGSFHFIYLPLISD